VCSYLPLPSSSADDAPTELEAAAEFMHITRITPKISVSEKPRLLPHSHVVAAPIEDTPFDYTITTLSTVTTVTQLNPFSTPSYPPTIVMASKRFFDHAAKIKCPSASQGVDTILLQQVKHGDPGIYKPPYPPVSFAKVVDYKTSTSGSSSAAKMELEKRLMEERKEEDKIEFTKHFFEHKVKVGHEFEKRKVWRPYRDEDVGEDYVPEAPDEQMEKRMNDLKMEYERRKVAVPINWVEKKVVEEKKVEQVEKADEAAKGEGVKGEGVMGEGVKGEGVKGEGVKVAESRGVAETELEGDGRGEHWSSPENLLAVERGETEASALIVNEAGGIRRRRQKEEQDNELGAWISGGGVKKESEKSSASDGGAPSEEAAGEVAASEENKD
jgi:hypothetical protein